MGRALVAATVALAAACQGDAFFVCSDDDDCGGAAAGVCEIGGACSFPDDACESGRRYGQSSAPPLAGRCTEIDEGTSTATDPTTTTTTVDPSFDTSTTSSTSSSSTGTP